MTTVEFSGWYYDAATWEFHTVYEGDDLDPVDDIIYWEGFSDANGYI